MFSNPLKTTLNEFVNGTFFNEKVTMKSSAGLIAEGRKKNSSKWYFRFFYILKNRSRRGGFLFLFFAMPLAIIKLKMQKNSFNCEICKRVKKKLIDDHPSIQWSTGIFSKRSNALWSAFCCTIAKATTVITM